MNKNTKVIAMLVLVFAVLAVYLFLTIKEVTIKTKTPQSSEEYNRQVQENIKKMEESYKVDMNKFVADLQVVLADTNMPLENKASTLFNMRGQLAQMTVPAQFKEYHLKVFLTLSELSPESQRDVNEVITEITGIITEAKIAFDWLN